MRIEEASLRPDDSTGPLPCCIVGGGPAGMMLGLLLARAGVRVVVLEKHADFLRDFRGDTIHPSTLEVMHELGLLDALLRVPHDEVRELQGQVGDERVVIADFTHVPAHCRFLAFMPQWDFLDFLAHEAARYSTFRLLMSTEVTGVLEEHGAIVGVHAKGVDGPLEIRADLVVAADGRHSVIRERAALRVDDLGAPMDVFWFRLSRSPGDPGQTFGRIDPGRIFVTINRGAYWQCGYVIPKGTADEIRQWGLDAFREDVARLVPYLRDRVAEIRRWDDVKLLTVVVDRLPRWYRPGLLCIGDAAHAMSPIGGVGINLAIQDAVAAANRLVGPLRNGAVSERDLSDVQRRRMFPTRSTQRMQVFIHDKFLSRALARRTTPTPPCVVRLMGHWPILQRIPARIVGLGFRPGHVPTPSPSHP